MLILAALVVFVSGTLALTLRSKESARRIAGFVAFVFGFGSWAIYGLGEWRSSYSWQDGALLIFASSLLGGACLALAAAFVNAMWSIRMRIRRGRQRH